MTSVTVAILTLNEKRRIERCITSAAWADQIVVVDSGSTDKTQDLARARHAQVFEYADWQGFAVQRNRLIAHCTSEYIFFLDADEELTTELSEEILAVTRSGSKKVWKVAWEQVAFGRRLTAMSSTGGIPRLFLRDHLLRFEGIVHEQAILSVPTVYGVLKNRLPHYSRENVHESLLKLAQYTQLGAAKRATQNKRGGILRGLGSAVASFLRLYIGQRGFLCGGAGFLHCLLVSLECFFRYAALEYDKAYLGQIVKRL